MAKSKDNERLTQDEAWKDYQLLKQNNVESRIKHEHAIG